MTVDTRKMVVGKQALQARTAWLLEIGTMRFRCVVVGPGRYAVEARLPSGEWEEAARGKDPVKLLDQVSRCRSVAERLRRLDAKDGAS